MMRKIMVTTVMNWKDADYKEEIQDPDFTPAAFYPVLAIDTQHFLFLLANDKNEFVWKKIRLCKFAKIESEV